MIEFVTLCTGYSCDISFSCEHYRMKESRPGVIVMTSTPMQPGEGCPDYTPRTKPWGNGYIREEGFALTAQMWLIASLTALLVVGFSAYFKGKEHGLEKYHAFKSSVEAESQRLREENARREAEWEETARRTADGWAAALAEFKRRPRIVRVRDACSGAGTLPGLSPTATAVEGLQAGQSGLGSARTLTVEECEARLNGSIADAIWIETVKQLTDEWHEGVKNGR